MEVGVNAWHLDGSKLKYFGVKFVNAFYYLGIISGLVMNDLPS
jgi:hypothetical protein